MDGRGRPLPAVALRKESVDRNENLGNAQIKCWRVALRKESVDRNANGLPIGYVTSQSLSARRAWIEISEGRCLNMQRNVALRKESVDRNAGHDPAAAAAI